MRFTLELLGAATVLLAASALLPRTAAAQAPVRAESPWTARAPSPQWAVPSPATRLSADPLESRGVTHPVLQARKNKETGLTLMIVGGAMFVGGLIIGDTGGTILAVGGLGVGAYGLYLYID
jgi:hypothetical protein